MPNTKTIILRTVKVVCFIAIFAILMSIANFAMGNVYRTKNFYSSRMYHDLYSQKFSVDMFFLGASGVMTSCDPGILDEKLGMTTFNLASASLFYQDNYFMLRDAIGVHSPKYVVLVVSPPRLTDNYHNDRDRLGSSLAIDHMRMSPVKIEYMRTAFSQDKYASVLLNNSTQCYYLDKRTGDVIDKFKRFYSRYIARYIARYTASENQNDQQANMQADIVDEVFNVGEIYVERGFVRSFTRLTPGILPKTT